MKKVIATLMVLSTATAMAQSTAASAGTASASNTSTSTALSAIKKAASNLTLRVETEVDTQKQAKGAGVPESEVNTINGYAALVAIPVGYKITKNDKVSFKPYFTKNAQNDYVNGKDLNPANDLRLDSSYIAYTRSNILTEEANKIKYDAQLRHYTMSSLTTENSGGLVALTQLRNYFTKTVNSTLTLTTAVYLTKNFINEASMNNPAVNDKSTDFGASLVVSPGINLTDKLSLSLGLIATKNIARQDSKGDRLRKAATLEFNPSVFYQITEKADVGVGYDVTRIMAENDGQVINTDKIKAGTWQLMFNYNVF